MKPRFWVKSYDDYNRPACDSHPDRDAAYKAFEAKRDSHRFYFVQMGVAGDDGAIVLNEWRKSTETTTTTKRRSSKKEAANV